MILEKKITIQGNVQGVFFRANTLREAKQLDLVGSVKNLPSGNVEIYAQGSEQKINQLINRLKHELYPLNITQITLESIRPLNTYLEFQIKY